MHEKEQKLNHKFIHMDINKEILSMKKKERNIKDKEEWNNTEKNKNP